MFFSILSERKVLWGVEIADFQGSLQLLTSSHLRERDILLLRAFYVGESGTDSFLVKPRRKMFHVVFVGRGMVMVTCFGSVLSPSHTVQHVRELPEFAHLMSLRSKQLASLLTLAWLVAWSQWH